MAGFRIGSLRRDVAGRINNGKDRGDGAAEIATEVKTCPHCNRRVLYLETKRRICLGGTPPPVQKDGLCPICWVQTHPGEPVPWSRSGKRADPDRASSVSKYEWTAHAPAREYEAD
jgi:hypothetical protein